MTRTSHPERADAVVPTYGDFGAPSGEGRAATGPLFAYVPGARWSGALVPDLVLPRPSAA